MRLVNVMVELAAAPGTSDRKLGLSVMRKSGTSLTFTWRDTLRVTVPLVPFKVTV